MDPELLAEAQKRGLAPANTAPTVDPELLAEARRRGIGSAPPPPAAAAPSMLKQGWDALAVPEAKAREGLSAISRAVSKYYPAPAEMSGNLPRDLALNAPKAMAESVAETAAKVAPTFVSRGSILTAGALGAMKAATPIGRAIGRAAEGWSGLEYKNPGILNEAANDSSLLFGPGKDKANAIYQAVTDRANVAPELKAAMTHGDMVNEAKKALDAGTLTPDGALAARQSLDALKKTMPRGNYIELRDAFDGIAKQISAEADAAFVKAGKSEALQRFLPVNKGGGTSIAKSAVGTLLGKVGLPLMSPAVQGAAATAAGAATRNIAPTAAVVGAAPPLADALMRRLRRKEP